MLLEGHDGEIYCGKFAPDGKSLVTSGFDRHLMFWDVFGECTNYHQIPHAHKVSFYLFKISKIYSRAPFWIYNLANKVHKFTLARQIIQLVCSIISLEHELNE